MNVYGYFELQLLVALVTAFRYDGTEVDGRLANSEADILRDVIKDKEYNHEEVVRIVSTRSKPQLLATFNRYREEHGTSISKVPTMQKFVKTISSCL